MIAPARNAALEALRRVTAREVDLAAALDHSRAQLPDDRDRALAAEIVLGTLRWRASLDHVIAWAGNRDIAQFDAVVLDILRISAYQLLHLDRVPAAAVVDDAVNLCKREGHKSASGAVNAILRRVSRSRAQLPDVGPDDPLGHLSVTWSHPRWIAERWLARLGFDRALAWVQFNNAPAPMTLRAQTLRMSPAALAAALRDAGVETQPCPFAPDGLVVEHGNPLKLPMAREGLFIVQDEASQLVGAFVAPPPGSRVLDACAAPGGKTMQMAAATSAQGVLVAADARPRRMRVLRTALRSAQIPGVLLVQHDLLRGAPFREAFDVVLVDAPCSGLGTIRRDPDIRWTRTEADVAAFADRQRRMLASASDIIRPGGLLVYSTCSSEPDENERVIESFLAARPDYALEDPRAARIPLPDGVLGVVAEDGCLRTTPDQHRLEAFFAARLRRRA